jgi:hypothetical protein
VSAKIVALIEDIELFIKLNVCRLLKDLNAYASTFVIKSLSKIRILTAVQDETMLDGMLMSGLFLIMISSRLKQLTKELLVKFESSTSFSSIDFK